MSTKTASSKAEAQKKRVNNDKIPDPELGTKPITGDRYYDKDFADKEWDKLWTKVWLIAGLESQMPNPNDYITCDCLLYTSPSPRDATLSRMPSSA